MNSNSLICLLVFIQWFNYNLVLLDHHDETNYSNPGKRAPTTFLVGGDETSGNVFAINSLGIYGPVCDDLWSTADANVVCRQLGFSSGTRYHNSHWGSVPADFAMDNVKCNGNENSLQECTYKTTDDCKASEGAGVSCDGACHN